MKKADIRKNHEEFEEILTWYAEFLYNVLTLYPLNSLEKQEIVESCLLRMCASWESFVEKELIDCVNIDSGRLAEHIGASLPKHLSLTMCEAILFGGCYPDFRSVGDLKGFAKRVLPDHVNPFARITAATAGRIDEAYVIRAYLTHQSKASRRTLMRTYRTNLRLQAV